jgi:hypothetical protein
MTEHFPKEVLTQLLSVLEGETPTLASEWSTALEQASLVVEQQGASLRLGDYPLAIRSHYGALTLFQPPTLAAGQPRRIASFDRHGRLLLFLYWTAQGRLTHFKVRGLDGRFLGVMRGSASHLGWGDSDCIWLLDGEDGFTIDRSLTLFRSVSYEDLDFLPPLDTPAALPAGGGSTILNVLAVLAQDQRKELLRYRGPYPSERLFAALRESFRYSGEPGAVRERFTRDAEEAAVQLAMKEADVDWAPHPHERFFPAAHTCVQLRDGIEKVYDRGTIYYRPDLAADAYTVWMQRTEDGDTRYIAGLMVLGQALEAHLVLDSQGAILERPPVKRDWDIRGGVELSEDWKAMLVRLIATESSPLLRSALWPEIEGLTFLWAPLRRRLWVIEGNDVFLHAGMAAVYRDALSRAKSAGERLLLAARFASELARLIGSFLRTRAQERLAGLSAQAQQLALLFAATETQGLSDNDLRQFLTRLAQGEELPVVT